MEPKFNINRPKISDEEINKRKDFDRLLKEFKERSLKQAQGDESWRRNKKVQYSAIIAGLTVICTITLFTIANTKNKTAARNETLTTPPSHTTVAAAKTVKAAVKSPSVKLNVPYTSYRVSGANGGSVTHNKATKIKVPANSFVDKQGQDIRGDVTIEYREFHHPADIIVSGIPMTYDSAGHRYNLESAGMFDIRGYHNGEPVFIKPDKSLEVELASQNAENRFNQYYFDTVAGNWLYMKRDLAVATPLTRAAAAKLPGAAPPSSSLLTALKNDIEVTLPKRIDSVKVIYVKKVAQLPRPKSPLKPAAPTKGRPTFKLDGSYNEFPELAAFDNVIFEVGPENTNYSKEFHSITWSDVNVKQGPDKGRNYYLNLTYRNRTERLVVYPVLTGTDLEKANDIYDDKLAQYDQLVEKRQADEKRLMDEMQAKQQAYMNQLKKKQEEYDREKMRQLARTSRDQESELASSFSQMSSTMRATRLFSISEFGIFNSDCPHPIPQQGDITPLFVLGKNQPLRPDFVYLVDHTNRSVYNLSPANGLKLNYKTGNEYSICVFVQNRLYLCSKNDFKQTVQASSNKFLVTPLPQGADELADLKKALEI